MKLKPIEKMHLEMILISEDVEDESEEEEEEENEMISNVIHLLIMLNLLTFLFHTRSHNSVSWRIRKRLLP